MAVMDNNTSEGTMAEAEMANLELQIEALIHAKQQLMLENDSLRKKLTKLTQERAHLNDIKERTVSLIKRVISQLRADVA